MAPAEPESSGAAKAGEQGLVRSDDPVGGRRIHLHRPIVELERASENDPVGPREHVAGAAREGVADLGLWKQDGKLSPRRPKLLVAEKLAGAEARAVEDEPLSQP